MSIIVVLAIGIVVGIVIGAAIAFSLADRIKEEFVEAMVLKRLHSIRINSVPSTPKVEKKSKRKEKVITEEEEEEPTTNPATEDAIDALISLGMKKEKARAMVVAVVGDDCEMTLEEIVRRSLSSKTA